MKIFLSTSKWKPCKTCYSLHRGRCFSSLFLNILFLCTWATLSCKYIFFSPPLPCNSSVYMMHAFKHYLQHEYICTPVHSDTKNTDISITFHITFGCSIGHSRGKENCLYLCPRSIVGTKSIIQVQCDLSHVSYIFTYIFYL